jgi:hypothetical protein
MPSQLNLAMPTSILRWVDKGGVGDAKLTNLHGLTIVKHAKGLFALQ